MSSQAGSIIYALVVRGQDHVLAEHISNGAGGNFSTVTRLLLRKIDSRKETTQSLLYDKYVFHYTVSDELTYLCLTDQEYPRNGALQFLEAIRKRFVSTYGDRGKTALAFSFNADFERVLASQMEHFNRQRGDDRITKVNEQIAQVKDVMVQNIDKVLERGEKIELLVDKSEMLDQHAVRFRVQARDLKRTLWWKNAKLMIVIAIVIAVVIYAILALSCGGFKLPKCTN